MSPERLPATDDSRLARLAAEIASDFFGEPPPAVRAVEGKGSVNKIFVARAGSSQVVVRMSDDREARGQYEKESWCIEHAARRGVPGPSVLAVGEARGTPYMIQTFIDGDDGRESTVPSSRLWRALGGYAKLIHSIEVGGLGLELSDITRGDSQSSWLSHVNYNIESLGADDALIGLKVLTLPQSKAARATFEVLRGRRFDFGLTHGDLSLKNTIVGESGEVSLLDWGSAAADIVPHMELVQLLRMNMLEDDPDASGIRAFLDGYGMTAAAFDAMRPDLEALLLLRAFDKLRWAIDHRVPNLEDYISEARRVLARGATGIY